MKEQFNFKEISRSQQTLKIIEFLDRRTDNHIKKTNEILKTGGVKNDANRNV